MPEQATGVQLIETPSGFATIQASDGIHYVPISWFCQRLGLHNKGQIQRIKRNPVLADELTSITVETNGGPQTLACLGIHSALLWLFSCDVGRMAEESQVAMVALQRSLVQLCRAHVPHDRLLSAFQGAAREGRDENACGRRAAINYDGVPEHLPEGSWAVYALIDPRDETIRYVGVTNKPRRRLSEHSKDRPLHSQKAAWLADLDVAGLVPRMQILEIVGSSGESPFAAEQRWIRHLLAEGARLTNALGGA